MSSAPTQLAVVVAPSVSPLTSSGNSIQKEFLEEPLNRQNSLGNRVRGNIKGKHLTRSHAMRESTSPPRTPTPRSEILDSTSSYPLSVDNTNDYKSNGPSSSSSPLSGSQSPNFVNGQHITRHQASHQNNNLTTMNSPNENSGKGGIVCNQSQLDVDFPKLTPPKSSKCPRTNNSNRDLCDKQINDMDEMISYSNDRNSHGQFPSTYSDSDNSTSSHKHHSHQVLIEQNENNNCNMIPNVSNSQQLTPISQNSVCDKENCCSQIDDNYQNNNSCIYSNDENQNNLSQSPTDNSFKNERINKKHRSTSNAKSSKPRLKSIGSSSSNEVGNNTTSGFMSRDNSSEQFTDQTGVDLLQFFKETLNKNQKDRNMLMRIEKDLVDLAQDNTRIEIRFPPTSSYNRMLIHRVAAFFGMEHNVDTATQQCVIVNTVKTTRIPDIHFKSLLRDRLTDEPRKSILKRDTHSFDDSRHGLLCPDRGALDRKAKSFEEREEEYEKARRRIFQRRECGDMNDEHQYWHWSNNENHEHSVKLRHNNKPLKVQPLQIDNRMDGRPSVSKSHSFGGYGGPPHNGGPLIRGDSVNSTKSAGPRLFSKQDSIGSTNTPWRLSPSSSGYKTQTQSLRSESVTPSPTGCGSEDHTPEPSVVQSPSAASCGVVWAVTDITSVPKGSVLINPQTLQPIVNQDGSIYHYDPSNLPPSQSAAPNLYHNKNTNNPTIVHHKKIDKHRSIKPDINNGYNREVNNIPANTEILENISEVLAQTTLTGVKNDENDSQHNVTKDNQCHREMDDIQEENTIQQPEEENVTSENNSENSSDLQLKPKVKNQATSPNIPSPEPGQITQLDEVTTTQDISSNQNIEVDTKNGSQSTVSKNKKDEKNTNSNGPNTNYTTVGYHSSENNTMLTSVSNGTYSAATYQQRFDGSIYTVPQPMVYAYPPQEGDIQGYFMPFYDQTAQHHDPNSLVNATPQTIYQSPSGAAVVPVAYPTTAYNSAPMYPGQVLYSPEQFQTPAAAGAQIPQYPVTYPVSYPYPYNGYWGPTMSYYVPQPTLGNPISSAIIPSQLPASNNTHTINPGQNTLNGNGKRATPPQQNLSSGHSSQSATPASTYQYTPGVPLTISADPNGPALYTIPQTAVFSNMLPYASTNNPTTGAGLLSHLPHNHQHNAVINPLIPTHTNGPHIPLDPSYPLSNGSNVNSGTPQSTPSTPLSNPVSLPQQQRNPPLFATPPILSNGYNNQMHTQYQNYMELQNNGNNFSPYDRRNINMMHMMGGKKTNNIGAQINNKGNYIYNQQNHRRINTGEVSHISNQNNSGRPANILAQKRINGDKNQVSNTGNSGLINTNGNVNNHQSNLDKGRNTGIRTKPGNLELRKNASQRNSPIESNNNSPNSNASNNLTGNSVNDHPPSMCMTRANHIPSMHHPPNAATAAVVAAANAVVNDACHQQLLGAYNHPAPAAGMYIKYGQTYFAQHMALPNNRRSPPNDLRPQLAQLTGVYPTVNMMLPAPRQMQPRHPNPNYKGNKPSR